MSTIEPLILDQDNDPSAKPAMPKIILVLMVWYVARLGFVFLDEIFSGTGFYKASKTPADGWFFVGQFLFIIAVAQTRHHRDVWVQMARRIFQLCLALIALRYGLELTNHRVPYFWGMLFQFLWADALEVGLGLLLVRCWTLWDRPTAPNLLWEQWMLVLVLLRLVQSFCVARLEMLRYGPSLWQVTEWNIIGALPFVSLGSGVLLLCYWLWRCPPMRSTWIKAVASCLAFQAIHAPFWQVYELFESWTIWAGIGWVVALVLMGWYVYRSFFKTTT